MISECLLQKKTSWIEFPIFPDIHWEKNLRKKFGWFFWWWGSAFGWLRGWLICSIVTICSIMKHLILLSKTGEKSAKWCLIMDDWLGAWNIGCGWFEYLPDEFPILCSVRKLLFFWICFRILIIIMIWWIHIRKNFENAFFNTSMMLHIVIIRKWSGWFLCASFSHECMFKRKRCQKLRGSFRKNDSESAHIIRRNKDELLPKEWQNKEYFHRISVNFYWVTMRNTHLSNSVKLFWADYRLLCQQSGREPSILMIHWLLLML